MSVDTLPTVPDTRPHLIASYVDNMMVYMRAQYPEAPQSQLRNFIREYISKHCDTLKARLEEAKREEKNLGERRNRSELLWPTLRVVKSADKDRNIEHHSYGNLAYVGDYDLLAHTNLTRNKIVSPTGTTYETTDRCESFLKGMIDTDSQARKREKKLMLKAKKEGNRTKETYHNNNQATIKIRMNSLIGGMGSGFNFLSSVPNFNSVTSIARFFIMNAYTHAERFLESNFYFRTEEQLLDFLCVCKARSPDSKSTLNLCLRHKLKCPTADDVYTFLVGCLHRYMFACEHPKVRMFIDGLDPGELCFIYYMSNMKHLVFSNSEYFKPWIHDLLNPDNVDFSMECSPSDIFSIDGDLLVVLSTVYNAEIPVNDKGNTISLYDCVDAYPDIAKRFVCIGAHMSRLLKEIDPLFTHFMNHNVAIGYVREHVNMMRDTIILSDTDSIIFTTKSWVEWYKGDLILDKVSFDLNALVVYWLSKANAFILYNVSKAFGALGKDLLTMNMKNEFMMPIEILTSLKKHYASILAIQEGVFYKDPRLDIKGVNLRGSIFGKDTLNYVTWFIKSTIDEIYKTGKVSARKKIVEILRFERMVYDSLHAGEARFLTISPVKPPEEYKDADKTIYFNFLFWEQVFGPKYGNIAIPTKCYVLPLVDVHHSKYHVFVEHHHPELYEPLMNFFKAYPDKIISRIPINPLTPVIPEELRPITNYRSVIFSNAKPLYLIMKSLGITLGNSDKHTCLYSDTQGWISSEEAKKAEQYVISD